MGFGFSVRRMLRLTFSVAMKWKTFFPVSHIQLASGCAGAEMQHSQTDSPSWPMEILHTTDVTLSVWMGVGQGAEVWSSLFRGFRSSLVWEFEFFWEFVFLFSGVFRKLQNSLVWHSAMAAWGLTLNQSSGGEKTVLCIVCFAYSLL